MKDYRQDYKGGAYTNPYHPEYCGRVWQPEHPALGNQWVEPYVEQKEARAFLDGVEAVQRGHAELKADYDSLLAASMHTHQKGEGDACAKCGLDLRHPVHKSAAA